jgi:hypothetical protein
MKAAAAVINWLHALHRGYKFAILLVAAWAPLMFSHHRVFTGVLMAVTTALFFTATGSRNQECHCRE